MTTTKSTESLKSKKKLVVLSLLSKPRKTKKALKKRPEQELRVLSIKTSQAHASANNGDNRRRKSRWCHLELRKSLEIRAPKKGLAYGSKEMSIVLYKAVQTTRSYNC